MYIKRILVLDVYLYLNEETSNSVYLLGLFSHRIGFSFYVVSESWNLDDGEC